MEIRKVEYFDWSDIQKEICKEMGIEEQYFRDYHKLVGGEYKDLWHEWLEYFDSVPNNDTIVFNDLGEDLEHKMMWVKECNGKEWMEPFIYAVYRVWDKFEIEHIKYSW
jgi:trans-2-enoyl-CoA reductase